VPVRIAEAWPRKSNRSRHAVAAHALLTDSRQPRSNHRGGYFDSAKVVYNMLNPSAATSLRANCPAQDYAHLFDHTRAAGIGVAGGALHGSTVKNFLGNFPT
jgi:hypothetical protein